MRPLLHILENLNSKRPPTEKAPPLLPMSSSTKESSSLSISRLASPRLPFRWFRSSSRAHQPHLMRSLQMLPKRRWPQLPAPLPQALHFESCGISPATSGYVDGKLNSEDHFFGCSLGLVQSNNPKKSWSNRLKLIGQSSLGLKLKASRAYLKTFCTKSGCSDESCAVPQAKECSIGYAKKAGKSMHGEKPNEEELGHRKSFSGVIKWNSSASSSRSSSFSNATSNGYHQPQILKRSSSVHSEVESSLQGGNSLLQESPSSPYAAREIVLSDVGFYSISF